MQRLLASRPALCSKLFANQHSPYIAFKGNNVKTQTQSVDFGSRARARIRKRVEFSPLAGTLSCIAKTAIALGLLAGAGRIYSQAMLNSVNNQTQMPVPGVGHDYQHLLGETVDLANGAVSFKLTFPTPKGRGWSLPISWTYNSSSVNTLDQEYASWGTPVWNDSASHAWPVKDGWDLYNGIPKATVQVWSVSSNNGVNPLTGQVETSATWIPCNFQSGMTFTGMDGVTHNLYTYASAPQYTNSQYFYVCPQGSAPFTTPPHGDGQVVATLAPNTGSQSLLSSSPTSGAFTVMDRGGTVYSFSMGYSSQSPGVLVLPSAITDRNGNTMDTSGDTLGRNGPIFSQFPASSGTSSVSLLVGSASNSGGSTTGGLQFNSTWTTTSVSYTISVQGGSSTIGCTGVPTAVSGSRSVLSSLALPNGQSYQFFYGNNNPTDSSVLNPYGLVNEVIFPDGGWIKYHWNLPSSGQFNEYAEFAGTTEVSGGSNNLEPVYHPYGCVWQYQKPMLSERDVSFDGKTVAQVEKFDYTTSWPQSDSIPWNQKSTTVHTTDQVRNLTSQTVYTYIPYLVTNQQYGGSIAAPAFPLESTITYYDWGQTTPLKTVAKQWHDQFDLSSEMTTVYGSNGTRRSSGTVYTYETDLCAYSPYLFLYYQDPNDASNDIRTSPVDSLVYLAEQDDYDFGNGGLGPLAKKTLYNYQCFASPFSGSVPEPAIPPEVSSVTVEDGAGHIVAANQYSYDGAAPSPATVIEHSNLYGDGSSSGTTVRGNVTSATRCNPLPSTPTSACSGSQTQYTFDIAGQPTSMRDPDGHLTQFSFGDAWNSSDVTPVDTGTPSGNTDAYLTSVIYADGLKKTFQYDYETGYVTTATGENNESTHYYYNNNAQCGGSPADGMYRLGEVTYPDGGETAYCYNDSALTATKSILLQSTPTTTWMTTVDTFDGMGQKVLSTLTTDPDGATSVATEYDGEGRVYSTTNPYRGSSNVATYQYYDALGRTVGTKEQDGNMLLWCFNGVASLGSPASAHCESQLGSIASTLRPGAWIDFTDERGNMWQRTSDAFGNLTEVMEPNGASAAPSMETDYTYDTLNNLLSVSQYGGAKGNSSVRGRSFVYDPLSRLTSSFNPETGTVGYAYDLNGNLKTRTDGRGVVTTYGYDTRDRLLSKTYSNDPTGTPAACYQYGADSTNNNAGRLIYSWTQSSQSCPSTPPSSGYFSLRHIPSYDAMGRIPGEQQHTVSGSTYSPSYVYDSAGMLTQWGDGITKTSSGAQLAFYNAVGGAGRVQTVTSSWADSTHPGTLFAKGSQSTTTCSNASAWQYSPAGALMNAAFGSGLTFNRTYDSRLRVNCEVDQGTGTTPATPGSATVTITGQEQTK